MTGPTRPDAPRPATPPPGWPDGSLAANGLAVDAVGPALIVGLGNPGPTYAGHRHNVGFAVVELLAERVGGRFGAHKSRAEILEGRLERRRVVLVKPRTFMNLSGAAVSGLLRYFSIGPDRLVVVHDELDLPFGTIRLKYGGGDNGHNGLRSITGSLSTRDYLRVRIGIGRPPGRQDPAEFVLRDFGSSERRLLPDVVELGGTAVEGLLEHGLAATQNDVHARPV